MRKLLNFLIFNFMFYVDGGEGGGGSFMGGGAGGSGGEGGGEGGAGGGEGGSGGDIKYNYPEGLDDSYHGNATLLKYADKEGNFNNAEIAKALIHASSTLGADKMVVPNKNFTSEQWTEHFRKMGVPEKAEDYGLKNNIPQGMTANEELFDTFSKKAHELGVLPNQAQAIMDFYNTSMGEQNKISSDAFREGVDQGIANLKTEWGDGYDKNVNIAEQALLHFYPDEEARKRVIATGFLDTIEGTKFFHSLGSNLSEDSFTHEFTGGFSETPEELVASIATVHGELTKMGKLHPQYASKMKQYQSLLNKKHGTKPVGMGSNARV